MEDKIKTLIMGEEYEMLLLMMQNNPELAQEFVRMMYNNVPKKRMETMLCELRNQQLEGYNLGAKGSPMGGVIMATKVVIDSAPKTLTISEKRFPNLKELEIIECERIVIDKQIDKMIIKRYSNLNIELNIAPKKVILWLGSYSLDGYIDMYGKPTENFANAVTHVVFDTYILSKWLEKTKKLNIHDFFPIVEHIYINTENCWMGESDKELMKIEARAAFPYATTITFGELQKPYNF